MFFKICALKHFAILRIKNRFQHRCFLVRSSQREVFLKKGVTAQKMKFSIKDFFSKYDQVRWKPRIWLHLLKKSLTKNFIFCVVRCLTSYHWNNVMPNCALGIHDEWFCLSCHVYLKSCILCRFPCVICCLPCVTSAQNPTESMWC